MARAKKPTKGSAAKRPRPDAATPRWTEVATLKFEGERFRDHGLDLDVCAELVQFRKIVVETAKALWKAANKDRKKLPDHFEETLRLRVLRLGEGSTKVPVEVLEAPPEGAFVDTGSRAEPAIELAWKVLAAAARDETLPADVSRELAAEYAHWGATLRAEETVGVRPLGKRTYARATDATRARLAHYRETPHEDLVEVRGTVLEANVRHQRFEVWREAREVVKPLFPDGPDDGASAPRGTDGPKKVVVTFADRYEERVITALKEHRSRQVLVRGYGTRSPDGTPLTIDRIEALDFLDSGGPKYDDTVPPIEETLARIWAEVTPDEWARLPRDGAKNLDHYIYGTPPE